jgi:transcription elongation factor GreA
MDTPKEYLSKEKHGELIAELDFLTRTRRKEIAEALEAAKALGDLSENAEYHSAREAQAALEERISMLEEILRTAIVVGEHARKDTVDIGSTVTIKRNGEKQVFTLVGSEETDVLSGKISNRAPLGEALMGKKKGDVCKYKTPVGTAECTILEVA